MTTTHEGATTWRDFTDALTPEQIAYLEDWEARPDLPPMADGSPCSPERHAAGLLFAARQYVGQNAAAALYADVAPPPEDGRHYHWEDCGDGVWTRFFYGTARKFGGTHILICGQQATDGTCTRTIGLEASDQYSAAEARQLAAMLTAAADELDRLEQR